MRQKLVKYIFISIILCFPILSVLIFLHAYGHFFMPFSDFIFKKEKIHIALVAPLESKTGEQIKNAVELYLNKIRHQVNGRPISVHYYDDIYEISNAEETALKIVSESESLVVLGHYSNIESVAAGKFYKKNEMPAITASASAEAVTSNNQWYFRVIPNARVQAILIGNFVAKNYPKNGISLLYEDDEYGQTLMTHVIATTEKRGLVIHNKVNISDLMNNNDDPKAMDALISTLNPQNTIFIAAHAMQGAKVLALLKNSQKNFTIFAPEEFATEYFAGELQKYVDQGKTIGFYLNDVYCATPYMSAIANDQGHLFEKEFIRTYGEKPIWEAACYYDALEMAVEAIRKTEIQNLSHIKENRRSVRDALDGFFSSRYALQGLADELYFDSNRDVIRPYAMSRYFDAKLISAPLQYQTTLHENKDKRALFEEIMKGEAISIDGRVMQNINVVYTWIDEISVEDIDFDKEAYTLRFDLSIRYINGFDFNAGALYFCDAIEAISPDKPVIEEIGADMTYRKYTLQGRFRLPSDFRKYPFDHRVIAIRLMNQETISNTVIYLPDELKIAASKNDLIKGGTLPDSVNGWRIDSQTCFEDFSTKQSTLGIYQFAESNFKINHSRFNVEIHLTRKFHTVAAVFLPVLVILSALSFLAMRYPSGSAISYAIVFAALFIGNALSHGYLLYRFPCDTLMAFEYVILAVYLLLLLCAAMPILWGNSPWFGKALTVGKVACPLFSMAGLVVFYLIYGGNYP